MSKNIKNRIGIRFGRLIVIEFAGQDWNGHCWFTLWKCKCDCGKEVVVQGNSLQSGATKSCGCLNREIASKTMSKRMGKNHPNYIKGKYCNQARKLKEEKRKQNNYTCQKCRTIQKENGRKLDVHHIDSDDANNNPKNMITLCHSCHIKLHKEENQNETLRAGICV